MSDIYAWYSLIGTAGTALGMMVCGWVMTLLQETKQWDFVPACRVVFVMYAGVGIVKFLLTMGLSKNVEAEKKKAPTTTNGSSETDPLLASGSQEETVAVAPPKQRKLFFLPGVEAELVGLVTSLLLLFGLDSFGSSLASLYVFQEFLCFYLLTSARSWITYYFRRKFGMSDGELGSLFSVTSIIQATSMLVASSIAKRFGNVRTMVFTHLPSCIFLATMSLPNSLPLAMTLLIGRACTQNMDVAPRAAFLAEALPAEQRTAIMGTINVVKTTASSIAPLLTGVLSSNGKLWVSFVLAGCLKIMYDLGILVTFGGMEREKRRKTRAAQESDDA